MSEISYDILMTMGMVDAVFMDPNNPKAGNVRYGLDVGPNVLRPLSAFHMSLLTSKVWASPSPLSNSFM